MKWDSLLPDLSLVEVLVAVVAILAVQWIWTNRGERLSWRNRTTSDSHNANNTTESHESFTGASKSRLLQELDPLSHELRLKENSDEDVIVTEIVDKGTQRKAEKESSSSSSNDSETTTPKDSRTALEHAASAAPATLVVSQGDASTTTIQQFANKTHRHPGFHNFCYWCDVESSLYRVYNLGRTDGQPIVPPYIPKSRRGTVQVHMMITNQSSRTIKVFWINYRGDEQDKGTIRYGQTWHQYSWIEHPWIFKDADTNDILLYYIPDRIIPTTAMDDTTDPDEDQHDHKTGMHRFTIQSPVPAVNGSDYLVALHDPILPFPAERFVSTESQAVYWTIRHMLRLTESARGGRTTDWGIILKYFYNILEHPDNPKYRRIRIANPTFSSHIWNTPARGLFLSAGFVEHGSHAELGTAGPYPKAQITQLSNFVLILEQWKSQWPSLIGAADQVVQPEGAADASGRAGFGVAGSNAFAH